MVGRDRDPTPEDIKNLRYMKQVINEVLRLYPSVPADYRIAINDDILPNGYAVPAGPPSRRARALPCRGCPTHRCRPMRSRAHRCRIHGGLLGLSSASLGAPVRPDGGQVRPGALVAGAGQGRPSFLLRAVPRWAAHLPRPEHGLHRGARDAHASATGTRQERGFTAHAGLATHSSGPLWRVRWGRVVAVLGAAGAESQGAHEARHHLVVVDRQQDGPVAAGVVSPPLDLQLAARLLFCASSALATGLLCVRLSFL